MVPAGQDSRARSTEPASKIPSPEAHEQHPLIYAANPLRKRALTYSRRCGAPADLSRSIAPTLPGTLSQDASSTHALRRFPDVARRRFTG
jgi:hypothetical protein